MLRFRALVTLSERVPDVPSSHHPGGPHAVMIHMGQADQPASCRDFPAAICRDDELPLRPGDQAVVTITVADDAPGGFFLPGQRFILWAGTDIGHGFITQLPAVPGPRPDGAGRRGATLSSRGTGRHGPEAA